MTSLFYFELWLFIYYVACEFVNLRLKFCPSCIKFLAPPLLIYIKKGEQPPKKESNEVISIPLDCDDEKDEEAFAPDKSVLVLDYDLLQKHYGI